MNLNKLTKFSALRKAVLYARDYCEGGQEEYRSMISTYYSAIEQLGAIKHRRPKHRAREIARKIKNTKRNLIKKGFCPGGRPPFGYSVKNQKLIINPEEHEAVEMMLHLHGVGYGVCVIARMIFEDLGIKVSPNTIRKICTGKRITPTAY